MARHIMAVCVVCLLCADHLPCQQHIETLFPGNVGSAASLINNNNNNGHHIHNPGWEQTPMNAVVYKNKDIIAATSYSAKTQQQHQKHTTDNFISLSSATTNNQGDNRSRRRKKRHADHGHNPSNEIHRPAITDTFVRRIFNEYGSGGDTINVEDFQRMLEKLGLHQLLPQKLLQNSEDDSDNETCIRDSKLISYVKSQSAHDHDHDDDDDSEHDDHNHHHHQHSHNHEENRNCSDASEGCALAHTQVNDHDDDEHNHHGDSAEYYNYTLTANDIVHVCPVLLYQLTSNSDTNNKGCIGSEVLLQIDLQQTQHASVPKEDIMYVWIYSFAAVFACSILGLVGVAIIPFMNSRFYKHIIQFLVALAVGTMTGDALLHLLPHSLAGQNESNMIFKGLTCMGGIVFFYITEHGLTMVSEWRKSIAKKETNKPTRAKVMRDPDSSHNNSVAGDKVCKSKYSSYPYCYDEIAMDTKNDVWLHLPNNKTGDNANVSTRNGKLDIDGGENATQSLLSTSQNNYAPLTDRNHHHHHQGHNHSHSHHHNHNDLQQSSQANSTSSCQSHNIPDSSTLATDLDGNVVGDTAGGINTVAANSNGKDLMSDTVTVILREHESSHHGHSHKHGHVHSPPESLSAVVWMIIMGDGLHNFTDGMAIGAAFAENLAGGFSTALAVFCHELPHELGDFAILIKAGMSVKSAVYYNLLTGVLSFIGMIVGIIFGQSHETAQWMFAAAAGLFIYIAMVDMMPEISAAHKSVQQFALQILGMSSGVLLMLLIAIYEGDLMNLFSTN
ncbi:zinc transporter foi [Musca vetustissima]|uniref:zinc transporter foi n=1 Tax=Musca vetustissima TaxID=27455 RepID=UPI002AB6A7AE|nr:zinc transporter foi [Musca vetustissima]